MVDAITSALSGINNASARIEKGAANIAKGNDTGRIIEDIVDIKQAEVSYKANIEVLKTTNDLTKQLIESFDREV